MPNDLSPLQQTVVDRLNLVGMEDFADRARIAWVDCRPYPCALTPAERATMEGALLCDDFKQANREAKAAQAQKYVRQP